MHPRVYYNSTIGVAKRECLGDKCDVDGHAGSFALPNACCLSAVTCVCNRPVVSHSNTDIRRPVAVACCLFSPISVLLYVHRSHQACVQSAVGEVFSFILCPMLTVDHTRVVLHDGDPNVVGSDYVNANYITVSR